MKELEEKIIREGKVYPGGVLNVGAFLNQQIDVDFAMKMGEEIYRLFSGIPVNKIFTIESSGIAVAIAAAAYFHVPVVFAKKSRSSNQNKDVYSAEITSFTHHNTYTATVSKEYLSSGDNVLIVDDFLATGQALYGLIDILKEAGASLAGCAIAIEKSFQGGGDGLRRAGIKVESLAMIENMDENGKIAFRKEAEI